MFLLVDVFRLFVIAARSMAPTNFQMATDVVFCESKVRTSHVISLGLKLGLKIKKKKKKTLAKEGCFETQIACFSKIVAMRETGVHCSSSETLSGNSRQLETGARYLASALRERLAPLPCFV